MECKRVRNASARDEKVNSCPKMIHYRDKKPNNVSSDSLDTLAGDMDFPFNFCQIIHLKLRGALSIFTCDGFSKL